MGGLFLHAQRAEEINKNGQKQLLWKKGCFLQPLRLGLLHRRTPKDLELDDVKPKFMAGASGWDAKSGCL